MDGARARAAQGKRHKRRRAASGKGTRGASRWRSTGHLRNNYSMETGCGEEWGASRAKEGVGFTAARGEEGRGRGGSPFGGKDAGNGKATGPVVRTDFCRVLSSPSHHRLFAAGSHWFVRCVPLFSPMTAPFGAQLRFSSFFWWELNRRMPQPTEQRQRQGERRTRGNTVSA